MSSGEHAPSWRLPTQAVIERSRAWSRWRFRLPEADIEDLVSESLLAIMQRPQESVRDPDALYLAVFRRRLADLIRHKIRERRAAAAPRPLPPDESGAARYLLRRGIETLPSAVFTVTGSSRF
jgi:DNA-directed RNA polymerase specialized sigma24 family protein